MSRRKATYTPEAWAKVLAKKNAYRAANKEKARKAALDYYYRNLDANRAKSREYKRSRWEADRERELRQKYGLSLDDVRNMWLAQGQVCAVCHKALEPWGASLRITGASTVVDHDHATKRVRGLLHRCCNSALGMFSDDPVRMERAIAYLRSSGAQ